MREEALESICAALSISFTEDPDHLESIIDRFSEVGYVVAGLPKSLRRDIQEFRKFKIDFWLHMEF